MGACRPTAEPETLNRLEQLVAAYFNAAPVGIAILDNQLRYQAINEMLAKMNGLPVQQHIGRTTADIIGQDGNIQRALQHVARTGKALCNQRVSAILPHKPERGHWIANFFPIFNTDGKVQQVCAIVVDITEQKKLQKVVDDLSSRLLRAQDEGRRVLARELHDVTGQSLTALIMTLGSLKKTTTKLDARSRKTLREAIAMAKQAASEVRTMSYLLHPPMLDEFGLAHTLRWYARGIEERSGLSVSVQMPPNLPRFPLELETAVFRVIQESIRNVWQHSKNAKAAISLQVRKGKLLLEVRDFGRSTRSRSSKPPGPRPMGVGIPGMRERVEQFGGEFEVEFRKTGTRVHASLPITWEHT
jgi:PAS domain S-box-containing protein